MMAHTIPGLSSIHLFLFQDHTHTHTHTSTTEHVHVHTLMCIHVIGLYIYIMCQVHSLQENADVNTCLHVLCV